MKNFLKLTASFVVGNIACLFIMFFLQSLSYSYIYLPMILSILLYFVIQAITTRFLELENSVSVYVTVGIFAILYIVVSLYSFSEYQNEVGFMDLICVLFSFQTMITHTIASVVLGFLDGTAVIVIICVITSLLSASVPLLSKIIYEKKKKKNQKNQRAE